MRAKGRQSGDTAYTSIPQGTIQAEGKEPGHTLQSQRHNTTWGLSNTGDPSGGNGLQCHKSRFKSRVKIKYGRNGWMEKVKGGAKITRQD